MIPLIAFGPYKAEAAPGNKSTDCKSNSEIPTILPTEKFKPGAWLSIPSINCTTRTLPLLLKPRIPIDENETDCVLISTPLILRIAS